MLEYFTLTEIKSMIIEQYMKNIFETNLNKKIRTQSIAYILFQLSKHSIHFLGDNWY